MAKLKLVARQDVVASAEINAYRSVVTICFGDDDVQNAGLEGGWRFHFMVEGLGDGVAHRDGAAGVVAVNGGAVEHIDTVAAERIRDITEAHRGFAAGHGNRPVGGAAVAAGTVEAHVPFVNARVADFQTGVLVAVAEYRSSPVVIAATLVVGDQPVGIGFVNRFSARVDEEKQCCAAVNAVFVAPFVADALVGEVLVLDGAAHAVVTVDPRIADEGEFHVIGENVACSEIPRTEDAILGHHKTFCFPAAATDGRYYAENDCYLFHFLLKLLIIKTIEDYSLFFSLFWNL